MGLEVLKLEQSAESDSNLGSVIYAISFLEAQ